MKAAVKKRLAGSWIAAKSGAPTAATAAAMTAADEEAAEMLAVEALGAAEAALGGAKVPYSAPTRLKAKFCSGGEEMGNEKGWGGMRVCGEGLRIF